jgi:dienelactone hydrolase
MAGGWCYVKEIVQPMYAEIFRASGLGVLIFDYRSVGGSTGKPRQHLDPWAQVEDYRNAISYLETREDIDPTRIGIWGISYSGGHVLILGAIDSRVRCVNSVVPVVDGLATLRRAHGTVGFRRLTEAIREGRRALYTTGEYSYIPHASAEPAEEVCTFPFPGSHALFAWLKETQGPAYENRATWASTEMLLAYTVFPYVRRLVNTPTLMIVAEGDDHTMWDLEIEAFEAILTPEKRLFVIPRSTHHSLYRDKAHLELAARQGADWFRAHLGKPHVATSGG